MTKQERCAAALALHQTTLNCAQSLLGAFADKLQMPQEQCFALGSGFGGGMRYGGVCGAVSSAVMVLGMCYPHTPENGMAGKQRATALTKEFQRRFAGRFGGKLDCRELLREKDLQGTEQCRLLGAEAHCDVLIVSAAEILCDMLNELEQE
ncbi:MAG: C_GCAxxG_C_C family protein [Oscillospiraceae bacterium]|nr:C_GCAxxG_C_C family protein [Oscillospiraceae bacterium]